MKIVHFFENYLFFKTWHSFKNGHFLIFCFIFNFLIWNFSDCFETSGSMIPRLVPEIEGGTLSVTEEKEQKKDWSCSILVV